MRIGVLASHPIQYQAPIFRELAGLSKLRVFFAHRTTAEDQAAQGFGHEFDWDVDLLSGYEHEFLVNVSKRPSTSRYGGCDVPQIAARIRRSGFDGFLVMGWNLKAYWQAVSACRDNGIRVAVRGDSHLDTPRSRLKTKLKFPLYNLMAKKIDRFLYVGTRNRDYLSYYGVPDEKLFFSPHVVDVDWFGRHSTTGRDARGKLREKHGIHPDSKVLMFVGKLQRLKRPFDVIKAVQEVLGGDSRNCNVEVLVVGSGELEGEMRFLKRSVAFNVHLAGFCNQSGMPEMYSLADVLVLPSESETWGLVVNEAMSCGVPAIVSDRVGCAPDLIETGKTGYTYPVGDIKSLAGAIRRLVEYDSEDFRPSVRRKMKDYSPRRAAEGIIRAIQAPQTL